MADFQALHSYPNLELALKKARKGKTQKKYVLEFEQNVKENLLRLQQELMTQTYRPLLLQEFIIRDPKTRTINRSAFRDRIVHHALCNIIEPFFEKSFIYDSYANRKSKGAFKAIARYEYFLRIVSCNYSRPAFVLKADIKKYFENVSHNILLTILRKKIDDQQVVWLIKVILSNYKKEKNEVGMPLGNLTSQFFANVYLNELDQFVKHTLKAKYYLRYVDDFVILSDSINELNGDKDRITVFLDEQLRLQLHPAKSNIISSERGVDFLGMRVFPYHKLLKKKNLYKFKRKYKCFSDQYNAREVSYDRIYDFMEGWNANAKNANTYKLRKNILSDFETRYSREVSSKEVNRSRVRKRK